MMRIAEITVENYRIFHGRHIFQINGNLIFSVGENNTGKSTLFESISFIKNGLPREKSIDDIKNKAASNSDHVTCIIKFTGNIKEVINDFSEQKYEKYVEDDNGVETLKIQRSSEIKTITQNGKQVTIDIKKVTVWNPETNQFENPSGIDKVIGTLFEAQFVWADTDPTEVSDFGATKICGRLLAEAIGDFFDGEQWKKFTEVHKETFNGDGDSISKRTRTVEDSIKTILESQYGRADVRFNFALPDTAAFYKTGNITIDDGVKTKLGDKGTGMQRAVALAMIQVYAQSLAAHPSDSQKTKPLFFFIDEPEICLHPKAQKQLIDALVGISSIRQIFVSTHSPYILKTVDLRTHALYVFEKDGHTAKVTPSAQLNNFPWSPSWGEINYKAYNLPTIEYHNELYGYIQERERKFSEADIEAYFVTKGIVKSKQWVRVSNGAAQPPQNVTLATFIRNTIHHPENRQNSDFTEQELKTSIDTLISIL